MIHWSGFSPAGKECDYVNDAVQSGWVSGGAYVDRLTAALESVFTESKAMPVSNGTAAIQLAYQTLGAKPGDEVIVPSFCFQAGANVAVQLGLRPVFCDVSESTWNQSVETIEAACTAATRGVVVVHNYGVAAPIKDICEWAHSRGVWVIEDCAEAWFSRNEGRYVGQYGDIATFSMHATKTIASGEGGVVLVNDEALIERASLLRSHGLPRSDRHYYHVLAGNNYRLSNVLCAIALAQFEARDAILENQRHQSRLYAELLGDQWAMSCQGTLHGDGSDELWATGVNIQFERLCVTRDEMIGLLAASGIEVRPGFYSASSLPAYPDRATIHSINADKLADNIIVLPTNGSVSDAEVRQICDVLADLVDSNRKET